MKPIVAIEQAGAAIAGRYRVEKMLGRGGMAIVYRVLDERTGKHLALKRSSPREAEKRAHYGALLEREYHTLAQLAHPHIIEVYDCGVDPRGPYYTMELLDGTDLQKVDRLPWQSACVALHDVASALAMLHSRGLLHRDVSMRNVQWTANARAKLFDFGAMVAHGISQQVVGTPPFVAPEALQLQALDGRVDIFALGALGYRLLTGRHAFPARQFAQLRDVWRSKPVPPSTLAPEVPAELSALVLRMLTLDRGGRPHSAGEIIERLRAIAHIEREDVAQISRAYLATPTLVGREAALRAVRSQILGLVRGDGGTVMFRGVAGAGRSRMLDACVLEGKLLGAAVVRADSRDAASGEWSTARALGKQLIAQFPKPATEAARLARNVLGHVLDELRVDEPYATITGYTPDRSAIIRELREWFFALSKTQRLMLAIDDLERVDEASLALLTSLAHRAGRHALLLAVSIADEPQRPLPPTLQTLSDQATAIELSQLLPLETEALMRSLFGDVASLAMCAARIHALSQGNPRAVMELAQHLVDTGRASYEAGSWVLPSALDESDLPRTLAASLLARLGELNDAARELADALALTVEDGLLLEDYPMLCQDAARAYRALDALVAARIVLVDRERGYFAQAGFPSVLQEVMPEERRRGLHARVAKLLAAKGRDVLRRAHHLLAAGLDTEAIELLGAIDLSTRRPSPALLAAAVASAERLGASASVLHRLRMSLLLTAPYEMDYENYRRALPVVLARLEEDCGLARYRQLEGTENERLAQAITQTQQAYLATPQHERVHTVIEAIRELAKLVASVPAMCAPVFDRELMAMLPDISPLFPLSPSLPIVAQCVEGTKTWGRGSFLEARKQFEAVTARINEPDRGGFDDAQHRRVQMALQAMLGIFEAGFGIEYAEVRAKQFESTRELRVNAWRIRGLYQLAIGNAAEASKCMRRAELLKAQEGLNEGWVSSTTGMEVILRSRLGDLLGLKGQLRTLSALAARFPGWRPVEFLGRSRYCELQGDPHTALDLILAGLELAPPLQHPFFASLAASHITLLADVGRLNDAVAAARDYVQICQQHSLATPDVPTRAALVLARSGACDEAVRVLEPVIEQVVELGRVGLAAGAVYEARAYVAILADDRPAFQDFADSCAREFAKSQNPALGARLSALFEAARTHGLLASEEAASIGKSLEPPAPSGEYEALHSRFDECGDPPDRARCALTLLLQNTASNLGYLYVTAAEHATVLAASLPDEPADPGVAAWVRRYAERQFGALISATHELEDETQTLEGETASLDGEADSQTASQEDDTQTATQTMGASAGDASSGAPEYAYVDADGRYLEVLLLETMSARRRTLAGLLVIESTPSARVTLPSALTSAIAAELLHYNDAEPWHRVS